MAQPIKNILSALIPEEMAWKCELFLKWESVIGGHLKNKVFIEKIDEYVLYVGVIHPAWAQELTFLLPVLKNKINALFAQPKIQTIRIVVKPKTKLRPPTTHASQKVQGKTRATSNVPIQLSLHEQSILASIQSDELQSIVAKYLIRCKNAKGREP